MIGKSLTHCSPIETDFEENKEQLQKWIETGRQNLARKNKTKENKKQKKTK